MGVFTTKTLLNSVGLSKSQAIPGAVAINWILKVRVIVIHFAKSKFFFMSFCFCFFVCHLLVMYDKVSHTKFIFLTLAFSCN
jgi:hypothetical protein